MSGEPTPGVGFLADPSYHTVDTASAKDRALNALALLQKCDGVVADGTPMVLESGQATLVHMVLDRAANLLRLAAEEAQSQRFQALGWPDV